LQYVASDVRTLFPEKPWPFSRGPSAGHPDDFGKQRIEEAIEFCRFRRREGGLSIRSCIPACLQAEDGHYASAMASSISFQAVEALLPHMNSSPRPRRAAHPQWTKASGLLCAGSDAAQAAFFPMTHAERSTGCPRPRHRPACEGPRSGEPDPRWLRLGGNASCAAAALWPENIGGLVSYAGYDVIDVSRQRHPVPPALERVFWYQHLFQTERGRDCLAENRRALCRMLWSEWSPGWQFDEPSLVRQRRRHGPQYGCQRGDGAQGRCLSFPLLLSLRHWPIRRKRAAGLSPASPSPPGRRSHPG
jgi:hypothetical protein